MTRRRFRDGLGECFSARAWCGSGVEQQLVVLRLGGFLNLSGLKPGELAGDVVGFAALVDYWQLERLGMLGDLYLGAALEAGGAWQSRSEASFAGVTWSGLLFVGVDNPLSPIYLGYGSAEGGRDGYYLFIGSPFRRRR